MTQLTEEQKKTLVRAFANLKVAGEFLKKVEKDLSTFDTKDVPPLNYDVTGMVLKDINEIDFGVGFIKSFMRVSVLQQIVPKKKDEAKT